VIHDSDAVPGLTNRILARYASYIGTGSPIENYPNYKKDITKYVGIPVRPEFKVLSAKQKINAKEQFNFLPDKKLVVVVGGGLGSRNLNEAALTVASDIISNGVQMLIISGDQAFTIDGSLMPDIQTIPFVTDNMPKLLGAADVVVTRAGATFLAELAMVAAAVIIIPNHHLAGDHQTKNAKLYKTANAALVINPRVLEESPEILGVDILKVINDEKLSKKLSQNLRRFVKPDALEQMTKMILEAAK
jgi:UDP-N-acetylglucosamine--N-acetylmuramyl-(pentapeptide) pyrophosphoryl-undecaprenol N-acetylglucosamine transferase